MREKALFEVRDVKPFLHPGRQADIIYRDAVIGYLGEIHPEVADSYEIKEKTYVAVIDMRYVEEYAEFDVKYEGIPKYPAVTRDISLVMDKNVLAGEIEAIISKKGGKLLEKCELFDVYEGDRLEKGKKSLAYSIRFRAPERTLEDKDVNEIMDKIIEALKNIGAELRS